MGYVEVGGNGSVVWHARHDRGADGNGHPGGAWGRDENPPKDAKPPAMFTLLINGKPVDGLGSLPVNATKITVTWGNHGQGPGGGAQPPFTGPPDDPMDRDTVRRNFEDTPNPRAGGGGSASGGKGGPGSTA
jgi:hypothetical protein